MNIELENVMADLSYLFFEKYVVSNTVSTESSCKTSVLLEFIPLPPVRLIPILYVDKYDKGVLLH